MENQPEGEQPEVDAPVEEPPVENQPADDNFIAAEPLSVYTYANADFVNVGEMFTVYVIAEGGAQPYLSTTNIVLDGVVMQSYSHETVEHATLALDYLPMQGGTYTVTTEVTDCAGNVVTHRVTVGVRDHSTDLKNNAKWENLAKEIELTGDWRMDVLLIAQTQLGNMESDTDFIMDAEGQNGYTLYGEWVGNAYADWCAAFLGWCFEQAETGAPARMAAVSEWVEWMKRSNAFRAVGEYVPEPGDIMFIIPNNETEIGHIGIVEYVTGDAIGTIEANVGNMVDRRTYELNDVAIGGYGSMVELMKSVNVEHAEKVVLPYEVADVIDFTAYLNTDKTVNLRNGPSTKTMRKATLSGMGTPVLVTGQVEMEGTLWYLVQCEDIYGQQTGYMMAKFLDGKAPVAESEAYDLELSVEEDEAEVPAATEEPAAEEVPAATEEPAAEEVPAETEEPAAEEVPAETEEPAAEEIPAATEEPTVEEVPAEEVIVEVSVVEGSVMEMTVDEDLPEEIIEWAASVLADEEMIQRALKAPTLDSLVIENDALIYVRTGEKIATYNAATGELIDDETGAVVAIVDMASGMVYPVDKNADAE